MTSEGPVDTSIFEVFDADFTCEGTGASDWTVLGRDFDVIWCGF